MRNWVGWAAAALVAAGCGGGAERAASGGMKDEHQGEDAVCARCSVQGGGANAFGLQFTITANPESGVNAGPGFGGQGVAAKGTIRFFTTPSTGEGAVDLLGTIDTILNCSRTNGLLGADLLGSIGPEGSTTRFFLHVEDAGEPSAGDLLAMSIQTPVGSTSIVLQVAQGNLQVHQLDRCEPPPECPAGQCVCPETGMCEPCPEPPPAPTCDYGMCWCEETQVCEPCDLPPHGHDGPPPDGGTWTPPPDGNTSPPPDGNTSPPPPDGGTLPPPGGGTTPPPPPGPFIPL